MGSHSGKVRKKKVSIDLLAVNKENYINMY